MQLVSREAWGARPPRNREALARNKQLGTAIHYSSSDADEQADHANCARRVRGIQDFHLDGRGWADIAYSYLACKHGAVYEGRGRGVRTAANGTDAGNDAYHAVCFLGDNTPDRDDVTDPGREAIRDAVLHCNAWSAADGVVPHSFFKATGCPGDDLRGWIAKGMPVAVPLLPEGDLTMPDAQDILNAIELLRVGDTAGGPTDTHDYASLEGVGRQVKALDGLLRIAIFGSVRDQPDAHDETMSIEGVNRRLGDLEVKVDQILDAVAPPPEPPA